jgi:hypothetical protein
MSLAARFLAPVVVTGLAIAVPAEAASNSSPAPPVATQPAQAPVMIAPLALHGPVSAAQAVTASATCVKFATRVGWANNGYFAGDLVTAAAICVAESAGDPKLIVCDKDGHVDGSGDFPGFTCPPDATSFDRGLWQLNTAVPGAVGDACAFNAVCNARTAYLASGRGTSFAPWSSYDQDVYTRFIDPAQAAVTKLTAGTVTSALLGECLVHATQAAQAKVTIANCGSGAAGQQWSITGGKLRAGTLCAAISSTTAANPGVVLRRCAAQKTQQWVVVGRNELRNKADGKCLNDPNSSLTAGTQVNVTRCVNAKSQTWWLP